MLIGVFVGLILKGADPVALFTNVAALLIVLVGSTGATLISHPFEEAMAALKAAVNDVSEALAVAEGDDHA